MIKKLKSLHVNSKTLCHMSLCCTACTGDHVTHTEHGRMPLAEGCTFSFAISGDRQGYVSPPYASHHNHAAFRTFCFGISDDRQDDVSHPSAFHHNHAVCRAHSVVLFQVTGRVSISLPSASHHKQSLR